MGETSGTDVDEGVLTTGETGPDEEEEAESRDGVLEGEVDGGGSDATGVAVGSAGLRSGWNASSGRALVVAGTVVSPVVGVVDGTVRTSDGEPSMDGDDGVVAWCGDTAGGDDVVAGRRVGSPASTAPVSEVAGVDFGEAEGSAGRRCATPVGVAAGLDRRPAGGVVAAGLFLLAWVGVEVLPAG